MDESENDLCLSISDGWNDLCQKLVDWMQHRIQLVIESKGRQIKYYLKVF